MATPKALAALKKTKEALKDIKTKLEPVVQRLKEDAFDKTTAQAKATVSLSIGMMKYMGARLQGLDKGRKADDPLRQELNQMRKVLAEIKARGGSTTSTQERKTTAKSKATTATTPDQPSKKAKTNPATSNATNDKSSSSGQKRKLDESPKEESSGSKKKAKKSHRSTRR